MVHILPHQNGGLPSTKSFFPKLLGSNFHQYSPWDASSPHNRHFCRISGPSKEIPFDGCLESCSDF